MIEYLTSFPRAQTFPDVASFRIVLCHSASANIFLNLAFPYSGRVTRFA